MKILVVDDERNQREALAGFLESLGHSASLADSAQEALRYLSQNECDLVISDFKMPYLSGNDLLKEIRQRHPTVIVMIMTAFGTVETAVEAMKAGAWDFITKPIDLDALEIQLKEIQKFLLVNRPDTAATGKGTFIAHSRSMLEMIEKASRVAATDATILITGETGTGKEELARHIHNHSRRAKRNLHAVNCAALPSNLIESELFGHVKGSFTGATGNRRGHFATADKSTLFLDEIGDLSLDIQVKLLRFLQDSKFQPVGSDRTVSADVRLITATNVDLKLAVEQGRFREDLYYRLDVIRFHIPPLRERKKDISALTEVFLSEFSEKYRRPGTGFSQEAQELLQGYDFPGNVRELRNIIERAVVLAEGQEIDSADLELRSTAKREPTGNRLPESIQQLEQDLIAAALLESGGNQSKCARNLGISERVLRYKLQKYNLR